MPPQVTAPSSGYRPRSATDDLKDIVEDSLEELLRVYEERFARTYGPMKSRVREQLEAFCRCGDPHFGFMRLHCDSCGEERFVPQVCSSYYCHVS